MRTRPHPCVRAARDCTQCHRMMSVDSPLESTFSWLNNPQARAREINARVLTPAARGVRVPFIHRTEAFRCILLSCPPCILHTSACFFSPLLLFLPLFKRRRAYKESERDTPRLRFGSRPSGTPHVAFLAFGSGLGHVISPPQVVSFNPRTTRKFALGAAFLAGFSSH